MNHVHDLEFRPVDLRPYTKWISPAWLRPHKLVPGLAPGPVMFGEAMTDADRDLVLSKTPLGREGSPANVAAAAKLSRY